MESGSGRGVESGVVSTDPVDTVCTGKPDSEKILRGVCTPRVRGRLIFGGFGSLSADGVQRGSTTTLTRREQGGFSLRSGELVEKKLSTNRS